MLDAANLHITACMSALQDALALATKSNREFCNIVSGFN